MVGTGRIAKALSHALTRQGYQVMVGSREIEKAREVVAGIERYAEAGTQKHAIHFGEVIVLAIPYKSVGEVIKGAASWAGKIVVDCTNPLIWENGVPALAIGHRTSAAEEIAAMIPEAKVVKAFNSAFAELIEQGPYFGPLEGSMFYCGDDETAKKEVANLIEAAHFEPIDCGDLTAARQLEPMAALIIRLAHKQGLGRQIAFKLLQRD